MNSALKAFNRYYNLCNFSARFLVVVLAAGSVSTMAVADERATTDTARQQAAPAATLQSIARLEQSNARLKTAEQLLVQLVNAERAKAGLAALTNDGQLADTARAHSAEMRDRKYFSHKSPTPGLHGLLDRYRAVFQTSPAVISENICGGGSLSPQFGEQDVKRAHASLMDSAGHRTNILDSTVTHVGLGIITDASGKFWITQMFSRPQAIRTASR